MKFIYTNFLPTIFIIRYIFPRFINRYENPCDCEMNEMMCEMRVEFNERKNTNQGNDTSYYKSEIF